MLGFLVLFSFHFSLSLNPSCHTSRVREKGGEGGGVGGGGEAAAGNTEEQGANDLTVGYQHPLESLPPGIGIVNLY